MSTIATLQSELDRIDAQLIDIGAQRQRQAVLCAEHLHGLVVQAAAGRVTAESAALAEEWGSILRATERLQADRRQKSAELERARMHEHATSFVVEQAAAEPATEGT